MVEWTRKVWYMYTMEYYPAVKKREIKEFSVKWVNLGKTILREVTKMKKSNSSSNSEDVRM